jgi:phosphohistidine phosphatase
MQLLVIRHAIAEEREEFATSDRPDSDRPLTDFGRRRMRRNARGLRRVAPKLDVLASSPYTRAAETARIVADVLDIRAVETVEALTPDHHPKDLLGWLALRGDDDVVAIVGHEPHLGSLVAWFMSGQDRGSVEFKKGGAALLAFEGLPEPGKGTLRWLVTPAQLRAIAD